MQDLLMDFEEVSRLIETMPMRGVKGTTGTQASFLGKDRCMNLFSLAY